MKLGRFLNIFSLRNSFCCFVCCLLKLYLSVWVFCLHVCLCISYEPVACRSQKCWRFVQGISGDKCSLACVTSWTLYMWHCWKQWRASSGWSTLVVQTWWWPESESSEPMLFIYLFKKPNVVELTGSSLIDSFELTTNESLCFLNPCSWQDWHS